LAKSSNWPYPESLDAVIAAPRHHRLILENDRVRVLDTRIPPGDIVPVHTHRWPGVYHTVQFSHFLRRDGEGTLLFDSREVPPASRPQSGQGAFLENLPPHSVENVGDVEIHLISVELKD
jgi:hypothetical protein